MSDVSVDGTEGRERGAYAEALERAIANTCKSLDAHTDISHETWFGHSRVRVDWTAECVDPKCLAWAIFHIDDVIECNIIAHQEMGVWP